MTNILNSVITPEQIERLRVLLDTTDFNGVDFNKEASLLEYGFVYDSRTGVVISTHPDYVWNKKDSPIKFGIGTITSAQITEAFNSGKSQIITDGMTTKKFNEMCDEFKINEIELKTASLGLRGIPMTMSFDDLVIFLEEYIENH